MDYVFLQVAFEILERLPLAAPVELVLDVAEELLGGGIVDAVRLPGHALDDAGGLEPGCVRGVLVLPAPVRVHGRGGALGDLGQQLVEHPHLLALVGRGRYVARHDLLGAEVQRRGPVGLAASHLELGDVRPQLLPRGPGVEIPRDHVLERPADDAPVRVVPVVGRLASDAAANPHLAHHLEHGLVGYHGPLFRPEAHRYLPVPAAVGGAREDLGGRLPELGARGPRRVREGVVVGRPLELGACEQVPERVPLGAQGRDRFGLRPGQSPSLSTRARNFFR